MSDSTARIEIFDSFRKGMLSYISLPPIGKDIAFRKGAVSHRIASSIEKAFPPSLAVDIEILGTDILVRNGEEPVLALFWSSTYLTEKERSKALEFHRQYRPSLTLAFSMLEEKDYLLIYRFESDYVDYLHIDKTDFSEMLRKRCMIGRSEDGQLMLDVMRRKRVRKA